MRHRAFRQPPAVSDDPREVPETGPVPVRDLMRTLSPRAEPDPEPEEREAGPDALERGFTREGEAWVVRPAGEGLYGTGRTGTARLVAIHFFRERDPDTPVREALVAAGAFPALRPEELEALFERATPIEADRGGEHRS